ncbi:MAG: four helix bundle protein [Bacteroidota bacterium]|nr:four helix bundle protein [Bacteroidota bacterium]
MNIVKSHRELRVYIRSFELSMEIFMLTKKFPNEEIYSLTDQIRRSSRSVSSNIAEAFRRRKYPKSFGSKLNESEAESAETQNWLDYALACDYINQTDHKKIDDGYGEILGMLVKMQQTPEKWSI